MELSFRFPMFGIDTKTYRQIFDAYPKDIAAIIYDYFRPQHPTAYGIARAGFFELCENIDLVDNALYGACSGGHLEIVRLMISLGAKNFNFALRNACVAEHYASRCMYDIQHIYEGCHSPEYSAIINLLISSGATYCEICGKSAENHILPG